MSVESRSPREWSAEQRRVRMVQRHHLSVASRADSPEQIAESLVAIHSTDPATVFLSVEARLKHLDPVAALERALYADRSLIRMHGMRKTIFVFPANLAAAIHTSTTSANAVKQRAEFVRDLQGSDASWDEQWLALLESEVLVHLATMGEASGTAISKAVPGMRTIATYARGTSSEATQGVASRVLRGLGNENRIIRGRPLGSWVSGQYRWSIAPVHGAVSVEAARNELVRRWLSTYGPGTAIDLKWWTGWAMRDVKSALAMLELEEVDLSEGVGYVLAGDSEPEPELAPDLVLLPALDSTAMGYRQRNFYLKDDHVAALFDYAGNIGPTIWWHGRIVGGWAQRKDGTFAWRWLESVPTEAELALEREIDRLKQWQGEIRVRQRFPTPLVRELTNQENREF